MLKVDECWQDNWRGHGVYWNEEAYGADVHVLVAYDDDYAYYLRTSLYGGICTVEMVMREETSGEEWGLVGYSHDVCISAVDAVDGVVSWGEKLAFSWLSGQGAELPWR